MRIAHVLLTQRFAGTERHVLELAAAQAEAGHEVTLVLRRKAARRATDAIACRVDRRVGVVLVPDWLARWPAVPMARRALRRLAPDVAHAHLGSACRALRGLDADCLRVATLHIGYFAEQHAHLDGLVAIAPWQLPTIPGPLRERSVQIDNWTLPRPAAAGARDRIRAQLGVGEREFLFGALGRVETEKGMDLLLDAFQTARPPDARLAIVGQGGAWEALRRRAEADVAMPGFVARPEDWMAAFDCFVSPAREEPFGLVLLEAMQSGLPVLATATAGASHLGGLIGRPLLPPGDGAALAQALSRVAAERPPRRDYPLDGYRVEAKAEEVERYYLALRARTLA
ncbi:glycosyltransferase [Luteimonas sp. RD2P54]|uniref:Glycosyltransferase n=1 Tax=Luteimonas endophytica TaxID=3042023 RepID=A0ABT6J558_9GAMM|nr:glycosyltransferase [Luteimonas endophytica]MDH5821931.1 glycosyltransferase [Luteimonas endophytica]